MLNYERGSEWRRWDLHIHTPQTLKNDQYEGKAVDEKWDNFYNTIVDYIGDGTDPLKTIEVIGITDYLSIDNYNKVMTDGRLPDSIKLVLPNVELRMVPYAKTAPVNIHCILILIMPLIWKVDFLANSSLLFATAHIVLRIVN